MAKKKIAAKTVKVVEEKWLVFVVMAGDTVLWLSSMEPDAELVMDVAVAGRFTKEEAVAFDPKPWNLHHVYRVPESLVGAMEFVYTVTKREAMRTYRKLANKETFVVNVDMLDKRDEHVEAEPNNDNTKTAWEPVTETAQEVGNYLVFIDSPTGIAQWLAFGGKTVDMFDAEHFMFDQAKVRAKISGGVVVDLRKMSFNHGVNAEAVGGARIMSCAQVFVQLNQL